MKSFECESSSEGDEPNIIPISRAIAEPQQWLKGGAPPSWDWQTAVSIYNTMQNKLLLTNDFTFTILCSYAK